MVVDLKFSKCTSYWFMVSFPYSKCTVILYPRSLSFDVINLAGFYKCISELWTFTKTDVFGNPMLAAAHNIMMFSQADFVDSGWKNWAALKYVASWTKCNTDAPSMNIKSMYIFALNWVFSALIVTRYHLGAVVIFWHGSQADKRYSSFSRVSGVTEFVPAAFSRSNSLPFEGWAGFL